MKLSVTAIIMAFALWAVPAHACDFGVSADVQALSLDKVVEEKLSPIAPSEEGAKEEKAKDEDALAQYRRCVQRDANGRCTRWEIPTVGGVRG